MYGPSVTRGGGGTEAKATRRNGLGDGRRIEDDIKKNLTYPPAVFLNNEIKPGGFRRPNSGETQTLLGQAVGHHGAGHGFDTTNTKYVPQRVTVTVLIACRSTTLLSS